MDKSIAYIGLGSNLGDRRESINKAIKSLSNSTAVEVTDVSSITESEPLASMDQPPYLNAAAQVKTVLSPQELFKIMVDIEKNLGRVKIGRWSSRTIDLDLLLFNDEIINTPELTIPHRQMHLRSFVLKGMAQLEPDLIHPVLKETVKVLEQRLNGCDFFPDPDRAQLICIAGLIGVGKTTLTQILAEKLKCGQILEEYDKNTFLPKVYKGDTDLALDCQLYFLNSRLRQLNPETLTAGQIAVSDYVFEKELIYAEQFLNTEQLNLYKDFYNSLARKTAEPVLVIYLRDSSENCLEKIHSRNRPYEQKIALEMLRQLQKSYDCLFKNWEKTPLIRLDMNKFDCFDNKDIDNITEQIKAYISIKT